MPNVKIFPEASQLARQAAELFIEASAQAIQSHGSFVVALSGGSTPNILYALLASEPYTERVNWAHVHFFWGDERCVPPDHPDSNYFRARTAFLDKVPVPAENIHRVMAEFPPEQASEAYEEELLRFFSLLPGEEAQSNASFDLVLLGLGEDGHTASLFPGTDAIHEDRRWVRAVYVDTLGAWRVTLTPAILNRAAQVIFLVSGAGKSDTLQRVVYGSYQPERYPAQVIRPAGGDPLWLVDEAAATLF